MVMGPLYWPELKGQRGLKHHGDGAILLARTQRTKDSQGQW